MTQDADWPKGFTAVIAGQVQRIRSERGMSAQQLAEVTTGLGHPVPRSVIANLESGRRDVVSVAELLVLARALGVPPVVLIFPLGKERAIEVLPGTVADTWAAAKWLTGEEPFPGSNEDIEEFPTAYFREQDRMIAEWRRTRQGLTEARALVDQERSRPDREEIRQQEARWLEEALRGVEKQLRLYRAIVRRDGVDLGELPPELAHVDRAVDGER
jgi:transcriptional regulator with XRE-family HTH domain